MVDELQATLKGEQTTKTSHDLCAGKVEVTPLTPPRFDVDTQKQDLLAYLDDHGYAVVASVADDSAVAHAKSLMWDYLEGVQGTQVRRDDIKSWGSKSDWLPSETNGIVHGFGFGQSQFMWYLRLLPRVKAAYALIWGTEDLLVSFDGGNVFRPWRYDQAWLTDGGWYHVDQNATNRESRGKCCVQGLVTLCEANEDTGGLVVIPGSHKDHDAMCKRSKIGKAMGDFLPVPADDPALEKGARLICAQAGDLILWDSRTVHCNSPSLTALKQLQAEHEAAATPDAERDMRQQQSWDLIRCVGYVCMTPARLASAETLEKRRDAFVNNVSTNHWPHKFGAAGHALPETPLQDPELIPKEQRALIGYDRPERFGCIMQ